MGGAHDYSKDEGRRFFCRYNGKKYYMACHKFYENDIYDKESTKIIFHTNHTLYGENFSYESFENGKFCLYYKDEKDGMKNWMLFIYKQENIDNFTPVFHKNKCSHFIMENAENNYFYIKELQYNAYLYLNKHKKRDSNNFGTSFYAGATLERNRATKFKYKDNE